MPVYRRGPDGLTEIQRDLTQAADLIARRGEPLSLVALAARAGYSSKTVNKVVGRLRATGRWYWPPADLAAERAERARAVARTRRTRRANLAPRRPPLRWLTDRAAALPAWEPPGRAKSSA